MNEAIETLDRGDKTKEELEESLGPAGIALVDKLSKDTQENINAAKKAKRRFYGTKNRKAWDRMNRKHKLEAMEIGSDKISKFFAFRANTDRPKTWEQAAVEDTQKAVDAYLSEVSQETPVNLADADELVLGETYEITCDRMFTNQPEETDER